MTTRKYTKEILTDAVIKSVSFAGVLRELGLRQAGGTQAHIASMIRSLEIDYSHFTHQGHMKGKVASNKKPFEEVLVFKAKGSKRIKHAQLKRAMLEFGFIYKCSRCELKDEWNNKKLKLEINHIDGNWLDSRPHNVEFICPNCHSQEEATNKPYKYRSESIYPYVGD